MKKPNLDLLGKEVYLIFQNKDKRNIQVVNKVSIDTIVLGSVDIIYGSKQLLMKNIYPENICMTKEDLERKIDELKNKPDITLAVA
jgi:hypothetical protein